MEIEGDSHTLVGVEHAAQCKEYSERNRRSLVGCIEPKTSWLVVRHRLGWIGVLIRLGCQLPFFIHTSDRCLSPNMNSITYVKDLLSCGTLRCFDKG